MTSEMNTPIVEWKKRVLILVDLNAKFLIQIFQQLILTGVQDREIEERSTTLADLEARISALECSCHGINCSAVSGGGLCFLNKSILNSI